ncbi:MAG: phosphate ABC transporter permease PstA [Gammaproteobacteria bacterium]|nr:phosphate ABC transporter permease PstA [Gammaproteobacteria bacterium]
MNNREDYTVSDTTILVKKSLQKRYRKENNFRRMGFTAILLAFLFLVLLFTDMIVKAIPAFTQHTVTMDVNFNPEILKVEARTTDIAILNNAKYRKLINAMLKDSVSELKKRKERVMLRKLISSVTQYQLKDMLIENPQLLGKTVPVKILLDDDVDTFIKAGGLNSDEAVNARLRPKQIEWIKSWAAAGKIHSNFNWQFFTNSDSRDPELAGIRGAITGTFLTILVTIALAFPIGVFAAVYLEEFAPKNKLTDLIEININNLAAVPSIVFGLLGLAVFINLFGMPRSAPLVGGVVLALMTLPTIIISSRSAIKSVPPSLKEAALGLGASKMQTVFHQVLPQAMPGILTGAIIGVAQAIGETAPLLMIGMVAFIVDIPQGVTDPATVLPVQIYLWSDSPERAFIAKTSAAILVLLGVLMVINASAVYLRKKFEQKW